MIEAPSLRRSRAMKTSTVFESRSQRLRVDVLGQLALRDDAIAMVHQVRQHAELVAGQLHRHAVERDPGQPRVERRRPRTQRRRQAASRAANQSARSRASTSSMRNGFAT